MRRLRLLALAMLFATSCAGESGQSVPTAPTVGDSLTGGWRRVTTNSQ